MFSKDLTLVYDGEGCDKKIGKIIPQISSLLSQCIRVKLLRIQNWDYDGTGFKYPVVYIASLDTEEFHSKIKPSFLSGSERSLLVLVYNNDSKMYIKRLESNVKSVMKRKVQIDELRKKKTQEMLASILTVSNIDQTTFWWPHVLKFVQSLQPVLLSRDTVKREIGVFFKIDHENGKQFEWYEQQKKMFETLFHDQCRASGDDLDEETYISCSKVVVMYADRSSYQYINDQNQRRKGKEDLKELIKETRDTCERHNTRFHLFMNEAGVKFTNHMNSEGLKMVGHGMFSQWVMVLSLTGKLQVNTKQENIFYSQNYDKQERDVFNPDAYPGLLPRHLYTKTPREGYRRNASMNDILMTDLPGVCYQPVVTTNSTTNVDNSVNVSCLSCFQRFIPR